MDYSQCCEIFGIRDIQNLPMVALSIVLGDKEKRDEVYHKLLKANNYDMGSDWFQKIYESEMSEGKRKGQHFTPPEIYRLLSEIAGNERGMVHEPTAGTGGLIIGDWWRKSSLVYPWRWKPWEHPYVAWELSDRALPLLLLNLSIRGIHAMVYHGDTLEATVFAKYYVNNVNNDALAFSEVRQLTPERINYEIQSNMG